MHVLHAKQIKFWRKRKMVRYVWRIFLLIVALNAPVFHSAAIASSITTRLQPLPQIGFFLNNPPLFLCLVGLPCEAPWVSQNLPILPLDTPLSITTNSTDFNFALDRNLTGLYKASLSPTYPTAFSNNELLANIASSQNILGTTARGEFTFAAANGEPFYLLLSGIVRGGETYTLSVTAVPEPRQYQLLMIGLGMLAFHISRKKRQ